MRKLAAAIGFLLGFSLLSTGLLWPPALAQCNGVFPAKTLCGNLGATPAPPSAFSSAGSIVGPSSSTSGNIVDWANNTGTAVGDSGYTFGTSGASVPLNNGNNFFSGSTSLYIANITSQFYYLGNLMTLPPVAATIPYLAGNQTWTGNNIFTGQTTQSSAAFTNITSVAIPLTVGEGGTGNATATAHSFPINEGTSVQNSTGAGTVGQCAGSGGPSGDPSFKSGCWTLLATLTPSATTSAFIDLTDITTAYNDYEITFEGIIAQSNNTTAELQLYANGAYQATSYVNAGFVATSSSSDAYLVATTYIQLTQSAGLASGNAGLSGSVRLYNLTNAVSKQAVGTMCYDGSSTVVNCGFIGTRWTSTATVTGFQVTAATSGYSAGTVKLYGRL